MSGQLHQMTMEYVPAEDRVMFRVSTTDKVEYRLWLTRRLIAGFWQAMVGTLATVPEIQQQAEPRVKGAMMSMKHQEAVQSADFSQKRSTEVAPPVGLETPMLVTGVSCQAPKGGFRKLSFKTVAGQDVGLNLTDDMIHALCHLVQQAVEKANWGLNLTVGDAGTAGPAEPEKIH